MKKDKEKTEKGPTFKELILHFDAKLDRIVELLENSAKIQVPSDTLDITSDSPVIITSKELESLTTKTPIDSNQSVKYPIPIDYQQLVETILNRSFPIEITPKTDVPAFEFSVLVPKRYSNAGDKHWDMYKEDRRLKVISYADGPNGVRLWCESVFANLGPERQAMVVQDRINAQ